MNQKDKEDLKAKLQQAEDIVADCRRRLDGVEKWEPKHYPSGWGHKFQIERASEELVEKAREEIKSFTRLLAYRDEFAPGYEFLPKGRNYYVYFDTEYMNWGCTYLIYTKVTQVYMPEQAAKDLVVKLNSGEVVL